MSLKDAQLPQIVEMLQISNANILTGQRFRKDKRPVETNVKFEDIPSTSFEEGKVFVKPHWVHQDFWGVFANEFCDQKIMLTWTYHPDLGVKSTTVKDFKGDG